MLWWQSSSPHSPSYRSVACSGRSSVWGRGGDRDGDHRVCATVDAVRRRYFMDSDKSYEVSVVGVQAGHRWHPAHTTALRGRYGHCEGGRGTSAAGGLLSANDERGPRS